MMTKVLGFAKDCDHVYYERFVIKEADPDTFVVLKDGYARDDKYIFLGNRMLEENAGS